MLFLNDNEYFTFDDVLLVPKLSNVKSRKDVDISTFITPKIRLHTPIISANMEITEHRMAIAMAKLGGFGIIHRFMSYEKQLAEVVLVKDYPIYNSHILSEYKMVTSKGFDNRLLVGAAIGVKDSDYDHAINLVNAGCDVICVDVAHGHSKAVISLVAKLYEYKKSKEFCIIAGNVATPEGVLSLINAGADSIKVGVGPGRSCSTRIVTGFGIPQLSAIIECSNAVKNTGISIIADGGIKNSGDIAKAIAGGAHAVMLGSLLSGTEEAEGDTFIKNEMKYKVFRGMASADATLARPNNTKDIDEIVPEGVSTLVPYKGSVVKVINNLSGGLRSAYSYCGVDNTIGFKTYARFIRVSKNSVSESKPHIDEVL